VTNEPWVYAYREVGEYPETGDFGGKWLVFVGVDYLDEAWENIKKATKKAD
jgi:hypothetical protein